MDINDFIIKRHPRARSVKFKASLRKGIEIILPLRFNQKYLPEIVEQNKAWIEKRLAEIQQASKQSESDILPLDLALLGINEHWKIIYIETDNKKLRLYSRPNFELVLLGKCQDKKQCKVLIKTWLKNHAKKTLTPFLKNLSLKTELDFQSVSIRSQQTRWGSCNADKEINLNYKLIFLPEHLMMHILLHELAHTKYLDHSAKFWRLVASFDPNWKAHSREVRRSQTLVPAWLE